MSTTMDIAYRVSHAAMKASSRLAIARIATRLSQLILNTQEAQDDVRFGLIEFLSIDDTLNTNMYGFTKDINVLRQWLETNGINPDGYGLVGDALKEALKMEWRTNDNNRAFHEKILILFTDGAPSGLFGPLVGADPWVISNQFRKERITLIVVGVGESIVECDDFYCALAKNTGGQYIPMINFERIFLQIIPSVLNEGDTIRQALFHLNSEEIERESSFRYKYMEARVNEVIKECKSMDDIRNKFFKYKSSDI